MSTRTIIFFASSLLAAAMIPSAAQADDAASADRGLVVEEEAPRATEVAREGQLLPQTFSATIGHKQVIGMFLGGYDSAPDQGPQFSALVEGQLFNRVALRVGVDYQDGIHNVYPSVGVRVGILRQER
ncbi:MAG: hypothetical protein ACXVDD_27475, partial [Polyangia bacterium]